MSYELYAFALQPGTDPAETLEELAAESDPAADEPAAEERLQALLEELSDVDQGFEAAPGRRWPVELVGEMIDVTLFRQQATISIAYAARDAEELRRRLAHAIDVFRNVAGWEVWDPQLEQIVDSSALDDVLDTFAGGVAAASIVEEIEAKGREKL